MSAKMKVSYLAVATASLILAGCGGESDGVSVETLNYTGSEVPAEITENNADAIGTAVKQVAAALLLGNGLNEFTGSNMSGQRAIGPYAVANVVKNLPGQQVGNASVEVAMDGPSGEQIANGFEQTYTYSGDCGGSYTTSFKYRQSRSETASADVTETGEDISVNYKDLCNYLDDDMELSFVLNGSSEMKGTRTDRYESLPEDVSIQAPGSSSTKRTAQSQGELQAVIDNATYRIKALMQYTYVSESNNPEAFVNKRTAAYAVSGPGVGGVYNYVYECPYSGSCTEYELTKIGSTVYKMENSYVYDGYVVIDDLYLPAHGIVNAESDGLVLCDNPAEGFSEGSVSVWDENDNTITITYLGCGLEPEIEFQAAEPMPE